MRLLAQAIVNGLLIGGVYALMSLGLSLIFGVMNIANAAQAAFAILAAYITYWLFTLYNINPFIGMVISSVLLFLIGTVLYKYVVRRVSELMAFTLLYLMAMFLESVMVFVWTNLYRGIRLPYLSTSISVGGVFIFLDRLVGFTIAITITAIVAFMLKYTYFGKAIRASIQNPIGATLMGVNVEKIRMISFGLGLAISGFAGSVLGIIYPFYPTLAELWIGLMFAIVVFGGIGSLTGTLIAAIVLGIANSLVGTYVSSVWAPLVAFVVLILTLWLRPTGIMGRKV